MGFLEGMALVAQLSGLHAIMLIALAAHLLRIPQCVAECAKLEDCARRLRALLQWPAPTGHDVLPAMAAGELVEAADLVGSYRRSTLWCRLRTGRSTEGRLREMQDRVNWLCVLLLCVHANLITYHLLVSDANATDPLHGAGTSDSTGQGVAADDRSDNTGPGGFESV